MCPRGAHVGQRFPVMLRCYLLKTVLDTVSSNECACREGTVLTQGRHAWENSDKLRGFGLALISHEFSGKAPSLDLALGIKKKYIFLF